MFFVERLTKWRTRSISPSSGNGGGASQRTLAGSRSAAGGAGTSHTGRRWQRRPGCDSSNSRAVDWLLSMTGGVSLLAGEVVVERLAELLEQVVHVLRRRLAVTVDQAVDLRPRPL